MIARSVRTREPGGHIDWYVEQGGSGPNVVLVPSGEGDCSSFEAVAEALTRDFYVTTFDTPGFSRTTKSGDVEISMVALAGQVASLVRALGIERATFYGCSSAGLAVLDLAATCADMVHRAVVHEAALPIIGENVSAFSRLAALDDAGTAAACADIFRNWMNEDTAAWDALGEDFHRRLSVNYPVWARQYVLGKVHAPLDPSSLRDKPITWTIGGLMEARSFFSNVRLSRRAGIDLELLPCKHFPQVSIPEKLANHIRSAALQSHSVQSPV